MQDIIATTYSIYNAGIFLEKIARGVYRNFLHFRGGGVAMYPCFKMQSVNYGNESEAEQLSGGHNPSEEGGGGGGSEQLSGGGGAKCPPAPPPKKKKPAMNQPHIQVFVKHYRTST